MSSIRAIIVDPDVPGRFAIKEFEAPQPGPSEALVQVEAISLNRGDAVILVQERVHLKLPESCMILNAESISSSI